MGGTVGIRGPVSQAGSGWCCGGGVSSLGEWSGIVGDDQTSVMVVTGVVVYSSVCVAAYSWWLGGGVGSRK